MTVQIPGFTAVSEAGAAVQFQPLWFDITGVFLLGAGLVGLKVASNPD
jgi:hypothetical protein